MTAISLGLAQFELRAEATWGAFAEHYSSVVADTVSRGAQVVVLPELVTTGLLASAENAAQLTVRELDAAYREVFPPFFDAFRELVASLAAEHRIWLLGGSHLTRRPDGTIRNVAVLAHPDGRVEEYEKLHLTPPEVAMGVTPGDGVLVTEVAGVRAAVQICADIEYPEVSRELALRGVELILVPSLTWNTRGANRVRYGAHARAMENELFVGVSTLVGSSGVPGQGAIHGTGFALVATTLDRVSGKNDGVFAAHENTRTEGILIAEIDTEHLTASRRNPEPPSLNAIRPELYARLSAERGGDDERR